MRFALLLCLLATPLHAQIQRKLVVISIGGLDARYLKDADRLHLKIPTLRRLMKQGLVAEGVTGVAPNETWAAASTLVTGVTPAQHGVLNDDSPLQMPKTQTLWQATTAKHLKTGLLYWPATSTAQVEYNCPQFWEGHAASDLPFDPIAQKCSSGLVQRISSAFPAFSKTLWNDATTVLGMRYLLQQEQPDLLMVHLADLDGEQHETGAISVISRDVLENDDEMLGEALKKLPPHTIVSIVSDHGFETEEHIVRPRVLAKSSEIQVRYGIIGAGNMSTAAALRKQIGNKKAGIAREISMEEVRRVAPELAGWVAAFGTMPGCIATEEAKGTAFGAGSHRGVHNLWPLRPNYRSVFILWGEGVLPGRLPEISLMQIAPTYAKILGVSLPSARQPAVWPKGK